MLAQINLKQIEQVWIVVPDMALADEWENNGCCAESLQPIQPIKDRLAVSSVQPEEWWPGQCVL